jgi:hypothetical protein
MTECNSAKQRATPFFGAAGRPGQPNTALCRFNVKFLHMRPPPSLRRRASVTLGRYVLENLAVTNIAGKSLCLRFSPYWTEMVVAAAEEHEDWR